jgi:predicted regulator of Ras-like GTPase activity (Roadblock/LC7/MglB family)
MVDILLKRLVNDMSKIDGVRGAVIVAKDGVMLASSMENAEGEGAISVFAGATAEEIATSLALGEMNQVIIEGTGYRMMVIKHKSYYVGIIMDESTSPLIIKKEVDAVLEE